MLPPADSSSVKALRAVEPVKPITHAGDPQQEAFQRLNQIALGKTLQAEVLSRLNDGSFLIKIADTALRTALPSHFKAGDGLMLQLMATNPRPTFLLLQSSGSATTSLSSTAQLLSSILDTRQFEAETRGAGSIIAAKPLLPAASADAAEIAMNLRNALSQSGLFYESHLHQWISGARPITDLALEPQAQLHNQSNINNRSLPVVNQPEAQQKTSGAFLIDIVESWQDNGMTQLQSARSDGIADSTGFDKLAQQLIHQQLNTLEQQRVSWHGELWPGQPLEWEVSNDRPAHSDDSEASSWTSVVRFSMPTLGIVSARIQLTGQHLQMQVQTQSEETASLLRSSSSEFADTLEAAGLPLDLITVKQNEQA